MQDVKRKCIYCDSSIDLSDSDIIPYALTNTRVINHNVCRIEHNNNFSDLFEAEVIQNLAFILNSLDITSRSNKRYPSYELKVKILDDEYTTKISSDTELFRNKPIRRSDGTALLGPIEEIKKIKGANNKNVTLIDVNQLDVTKIIDIDISVFFSEAMYRLIAKIAFEWYCLHNNVNGKLGAFTPLISFIIQGGKNNIVKFIESKNIYDILQENTTFGSHTIISYIDCNNSVNILVCLFGVAAYTVKICNNLIEECKYNAIFQSLSLENIDINKNYNTFKYPTFEVFEENFWNKFSKKDTNIGSVFVPKNSQDYSLQPMYCYYLLYLTVLNDLQCDNNINEKAINLIITNITNLLQTSALTLRSLKRFVKEHYGNFDKEFKFRQECTDKKSIFLIYAIFIIGESNGIIKNLKDLNKAIKKKIVQPSISITDKLNIKLRNEIFSTPNYEDIILKGAKAVDSWSYE